MPTIQADPKTKGASLRRTAAVNEPMKSPFDPANLATVVTARQDGSAGIYNNEVLGYLLIGTKLRK
ncbi:hypothetical protein J22TS1_00870 [Siminovitchia terrae]|nr:hypothetical protein J22TS1_00870 [Siminovitchia terrae]